ncbi:type IV secretion system DNA-binding domain-containing protein [Tunturiibacter lichenicola]|uniref:type IV secretion system DNA-binding domain-containing protein n=1 Tax=Tunturiibacter lichenicola TaxID=2051959 RepID=UPI0021B1C9A0|nr:type IV secretion system DNA-binding domain-containing protein [Edaphobacter lichenicola]
MKTAPGRKPETILPEDAVSGPNPKLPVSLSPKALAEGWRGVIQTAPEKVYSSELVPYLQATIYDGEGVWWLFARPMLYSLAGILLLYTLRLQFKDGWSSGRNRAHEERHGRRTKGPELQSGGWRRRLGTDGISFLLRFEKAPWRWLPFGPSFRIPRRLESSHIELIGDTGSGKSTAIRQILRQVQRRGETAIVYDPAMDFVGEFYDFSRGDLILNPLDARCPCWRIDQEIVRDETAATIAAAFIPDKEYEKEFFTHTPRRLLAAMLQRRMPAHFLLRWMSDPEALADIVKGTPLAAMIDPTAPAQRVGVLSSLNLAADSFELLPEGGNGRQDFATADWIKERKRWVFLTSQSDYREKILPLHSAWLDLFILRMQGPCDDRYAKPVWFVLDELASLNKLPQLHAAVTENRKHGNPVVLGFQGRSQLEKRYGQDAETMLSQPATKVFLRTSEPRAAKWISDAIGEIEVERLKESRSMGLIGSKKSYAMEIATKPLIMPSEISGLESLHGFIKQENRVVSVFLRLTKGRSKHPKFIERKMPEPVPRPTPQVPATPAHMPPPKKPAAVQDALPLTDSPPAVANPKKEAFIWDETKGIE